MCVYCYEPEYSQNIPWKSADKSTKYKIIEHKIIQI